MTDCPYCESDTSEISEQHGILRLFCCTSCNEAYLVESDGLRFASARATPPPPLAARVRANAAIADVIANLDESIAHLPTIPIVPQQVIKAIQNPATTSDDLAQMIQEDAALTVRVLKLANSVAFGGREPTSDLKLACARLGTRNLSNVANVVAHGHLYGAKDPAFADLIHKLWEHAVATARLADSLADAGGGLPEHSIFLAGLVHDIGKAVLLDAITTHGQAIKKQFAKDHNLLTQTLDDFGPYAGLRVAQHWALPTEVRFSTFYAATPESTPREYALQALLIALASDVAEVSGHGMSGKALHDIDHLSAAFAGTVKLNDVSGVLERATADVDPFMAMA